jgi:transcriptional regulator with XRE-family HTH domain
MWLENLKDLRKKTGLSSKQIADMTNLPERTVVRIFSGDTDNPYVDTLHRIVTVLGGSLDDVLADSKTVLGTKNLATLQEDADRLGSEVSLLKAEVAVLRDKVTALSAENDLLRLNLAHKEEIIALHNYYNKLKGTE